MNYARRGGWKKAVLEVRFFREQDEIPRECIATDWAWWHVPRDFHEVRLVGETWDDRSRRMAEQSKRAGAGNGTRGKA